MLFAWKEDMELNGMKYLDPSRGEGFLLFQMLDCSSISKRFAMRMTAIIPAANQSRSRAHLPFCPLGTTAYLIAVTWSYLSSIIEYFVQSIGLFPLNNHHANLPSTMNTIDATEHYETSANDPHPSLLTIIIDTNPSAWSLLSQSLSLSQAIADILVFINAHLACNYANEVAVVASHNHKASWLYPRQPPHPPHQTTNSTDPDGDIAMNGSSNPSTAAPPAGSVNKYRPFREVEEQITHHLHELLKSTQPDDIRSTTSTLMAGALTMALSHINRRSIAWAEAQGGNPDLEAANAATADTGTPAATAAGGRGSSAAGTELEGLQARILIVSVSSSTDSAHQYIPIMNGIFACQRLRIPIDVCKLSGDAVFLQQASDATRGVYMALGEPRGLLQYLMMAFLPDQRSRRHLVQPTRVDVDFRAACFCHRRVVDVGFVCSICLSIFCEPPENGDCLTCGTHLDMGDYGAKPAVVARRKKKKKLRPNGASNAGTPTPTPTPGP